MRTFAIVLGLAFAAVAIAYWLVPAGSLPSVFPGFGRLDARACQARSRRGRRRRRAFRHRVVRRAIPHVTERPAP